MQLLSDNICSISCIFPFSELKIFFIIVVGSSLLSSLVHSTQSVNTYEQKIITVFVDKENGTHFMYYFHVLYISRHNT